MWIVYEYSFDEPKMTNKLRSTSAQLKFMHIFQNVEKTELMWHWLLLKYQNWIHFFDNSRLNVNLRESHL